MRYLNILFLGLIIGVILAPRLTVYRASCDTTKYGWMWATQSRFDKEGFKCKDSNQVIEKESSGYMILQVLKIELFQ